MIVRKHFLWLSKTRDALIVALLLLFSTVADGVLLFRTGDTTANTAEPTGALAGSGWQYEGTFGAFLGTAIAPHYFITAKHLANGPIEFFFHGVNYPIVRSFADPDADLKIVEVTGTLPFYAPLYSRKDEVGKNLLVIGRGTQRGTERVVNGKMCGWNWGASDSVQRWGQNQVSNIVADKLHALFDQAGLPEEAQLSSGDSGGGVFLSDGGVWKLAGVNSDVDHFASGPSGGGPYEAALFDERGSYRSDGTLVTGKVPVPSGFYAARISSRISWIKSVIGNEVPGKRNSEQRPGNAAPELARFQWRHSRHE